MKFPFVTRKRLCQAIGSAIEWHRRYVDAEARLAATRAELAQTVDCYNAMRKLEQEERWRRLKAEGAVAYKDDRIRRVLGLPGFAEEAPTTKHAVLVEGKKAS